MILSQAVCWKEPGFFLAGIGPVGEIDCQQKPVQHPAEGEIPVSECTHRQRVDPLIAVCTIRSPGPAMAAQPSWNK